jgi:hypothetical protein
MTSGPRHKWTFRARFRRGAFGWRSGPAVTRIREAVSEIRKAARKDPDLGAEGAVLFLEKVSAAIEHVDGSSGSIGTAVNNAVDALVPIIAGAPGEGKLRDAWLDRLWQAVQDDEMPYIERLIDYWGALCVTPERASRWADGFIDEARRAWSPDPEQRYYFPGTSACLSCLFTAGRYDEILELLDLAPPWLFHDRMWGAKALAAMGKTAEAIRYAEDSGGPNASSFAIAEVCEEILLSNGAVEEAYDRYAIEANRKTTYLATFRAIAGKYPHKEPPDILRDLVASTPGAPGKWFAAAKSVGLYDEAIELVGRSPCEPRTLIRAARDAAATEPRFAVEAGMAALRWLVAGYGYEIAASDVQEAYDYTMAAAENAGCAPETLERIRDMVAGEVHEDRFVARALSVRLGTDR